MDVGAALVAARKAPVVVKPGERALHDPALAAQPGAVLYLAFCDSGSDPTGAQL